MRGIRYLPFVAISLTGGLFATASPAALACAIVTDPAGDGRIAVGAPWPEQARAHSLDIVSVAAGSNLRVLTLVVRVVQLSALESEAPQGGRLTTNFVIGNNNWRTEMLHTPDREEFQLARIVTTELPGGLRAESYEESAILTGVFDMRRSEVRVHIPVAQLRIARGVGAITSVAAFSHYYVEVPHGPSSEPAADETEATGRYQLRARSCITPGR